MLVHIKPQTHIFLRILIAGCLTANVLSSAIALAQVTGERGITPVASSSGIDVTGIDVNARGSSAEDARQKGWQQAQIRAWRRIGGPALEDSEIESLVSAIVIEKEEIGPRRYKARLGITFDRNRAAQYLGREVRGQSSAPVILLPVLVTAGTHTMYELRNLWQQAWADFNPGRSRINYVRPSGAGGDSLLLNHGQTSRRSRAWWRVILDQYGAADVLVAIARLVHSYPGGPIEGIFTARYGPDNRVLDSFRLSSQSGAELPAMLSEAVLEFDSIYQRALRSGLLKPDPTLEFKSDGEMSPALSRLIELGRSIAAANEARQDDVIDNGAEANQEENSTEAIRKSVTIQFSNLGSNAIEEILGLVRSVPGDNSAESTSLALESNSLMEVILEGSIEEFTSNLSSLGYSVTTDQETMVISK
jgi:hypothetical protein